MNMTTHSKDTDTFKLDVAYRLQLTRLAFAIPQCAFGERAGLKRNTYNHYETGQRLLSINAARLLCDTYGLSLDWLYRGDRNSLPYGLIKKIQDIEARVS